MPVYGYECQNCGHIFEEITNRHPSFDQMTCRRCQGYSKRIMSLTSFRLKGRGWAKDRYGTVSKQQSPEPALMGDG